MIWRVEFRPEVEDDVADAVTWYESREAGLGKDFLAEVFRVWERLARDPLTGARGRKTSNIRWHYPVRFPYKVIFDIGESERRVVVVAVVHAARHDQHWRMRSEEGD